MDYLKPKFATWYSCEGERRDRQKKAMNKTRALKKTLKLMRERANEGR